jgi:hypothetical protein
MKRKASDEAHTSRVPAPDEHNSPHAQRVLPQTQRSNCGQPFSPTRCATPDENGSNNQTQKCTALRIVLVERDSDQRPILQQTMLRVKDPSDMTSTPACSAQTLVAQLRFAESSSHSTFSRTPSPTDVADDQRSSWWSLQPVAPLCIIQNSAV